MAHDDEFDARRATPRPGEQDSPAQPEQPGDEGFEQGYDQPPLARGGSRGGSRAEISREDPPGHGAPRTLSAGAEQAGEDPGEGRGAALQRGRRAEPHQRLALLVGAPVGARVNAAAPARGSRAGAERGLDEPLAVGRARGEHDRVALELADARRAGRRPQPEHMRRARAWSPERRARSSTSCS